MDWTQQIIIILIYFTSAKASEDGLSYDPAELLSKIFSPNITARQRGYGFRFDDSPTEEYGLIDRPLRFDDRPANPLKFEDPKYNYDQNIDIKTPLKFEDSHNQNFPQNNDLKTPIKFEDIDQGNSGVSFQDDNSIDSGKKKRKRRRKPKQLGTQAGTYSGFGYAPMYNNFGYQGPIRRPRRPRPSIASEALSAITGALTSIARYDDYQCVPRLLCEAAGGGTLGSGGILDTVAGMQPLLTLLSAYNGISSSPLFVFGRAVFLGMTSKGNTATCRYAYSQCPTDPEQLIHYLNNYNGGFFRFFSNPQQPNQNVEQFYQQLSQNGLYYGQQHSNGYYDPNLYGQNYPLNHYNQYQGNGYQSPSLYQNQYNQNYALGYNYNYNNIRFKDIQNRIQNNPVENDNEEFDIYEDKINNKFSFPEEYNNHNNNYENNDSTLKFPDSNEQNDKNRTRRGKRVNFNNQNNKPKYHNYNDYNNNNQQNNNKYGFHNNNYNSNKYGIHNFNDFNKATDTNFNNDYYNKHALNNYYDTNNRYQNNNNPGNNNKYGFVNNNYNNQVVNNNPTGILNNEDYYFDYKHNFYVKRNKVNNNKVNNYNNNYNANNNYYNNGNRYNNDNANGITTVYIVRGNGDPNNPEIVRVRPGQSVH